MAVKYLKSKIGALPRIKPALLGLSFLLFALFGAVYAGGTYYISLAEVLPEPTMDAMRNALPESTRIYDRNGELLYEAHGDIKRRVISLDEIPDYLQKATIAIEDKNFYTHNGYELSAIARAAKVNIENMDIRQGASTLTQQLARTTFLNNQKLFSRKIKELILAIRIEHNFDKDQILELYLNSIPYGSNAHGVVSASEIYFNKKVRDLTLLESAYLAALPKAPTDYSPFRPDIQALHNRAQFVLLKMFEQGYLSEDEYSEAVGLEKLAFKKPPIPINAPHFVFYVLDELKKQIGDDALRKGGYDVYTSLDLGLQKQAEKIVAEWGEKNEAKFGAGNAALTAINTDTGEILAMVGSRNYFRDKDGAVNVALRPRQPGSSFKPYVYAAALAKDLNANSVIVDARTDFASANYGVQYIPQNYTGKHYGHVTVRKALAGSLNVPAVKVLVQTGVDTAIDLAEKLGISTLGDRNRFGPALALGGGEVKLLEHTAAMGAFGSEGVKHELSPILEIKDKKGNTFYKWEKQPGTQAIDSITAYEINDILSDTKAREYIFGGGANLKLQGRQVAVKTGTTQEFRDAWTIGYVPGLSVGVWVGNNDNSPMKAGADGSVVAAPIWKEFISFALKDKPVVAFSIPSGMKPIIATTITPKPNIEEEKRITEEEKRIDEEKKKEEKEKTEERRDTAEARETNPGENNIRLIEPAEQVSDTKKKDRPVHPVIKQDSGIRREGVLPIRLDFDDPRT